ncbi:MAG: Txe/YoeB family addiction module toxin [Micrococcales bacterium]|nr:Txe/YoeB family addiction module toxin [Micrococcales bacterium]
MTVTFSGSAWDEYLWWQANDRRILRKINTLIKAAQATPDEGIGKPERLRNELSGYWSRRITDEHRLVYRIADDGGILVAACRYHYGP